VTLLIDWQEAHQKVSRNWCHCRPVIFCFIKIQNGLTFQVPAYPGTEAIIQMSWSEKIIRLGYIHEQQYHFIM